MSGALNIIKSVASFVAPVLDIVQMIPGVGALAGIAKSAMNVISNLDQAFSDFPKGLISVAIKAASDLLPTPLKQIGEFLQDPGKGLFALIPDSVRSFLPSSLVPAVPGVINDLLPDWL